jgi:hypothetical protein
MANNIKGNAPNAIVAKVTIDFPSAGITSSNTAIIYLVDDPLKSYVPGRPINGITGFVSGKGYYMVALQDMDLEDAVVPPLPGSSSEVSYLFSGANQVISVASPTPLLFNSGNFSIIFDGKITAAGGSFVMSKGTTTVHGWDILLSDVGSGVVEFSGGVFDAGGTAFLYKKITPLALNTTYRCALVFNGTSVVLYVNGAVTGTVDQSSGTFVSIEQSGTFGIGKYLTGNAANSQLDELLFVSRALTSGEITADYNGGSKFNRSSVSFYADVIAYYRFNNNLNDEKGAHNGTATTPQYV